MQHQQSSAWLHVADYQLHLRQLIPDKADCAYPVLMLHGAIENSRIFYNEKGRGLGCFLADRGFDVTCADFAGRGPVDYPVLEPAGVLITVSSN